MGQFKEQCDIDNEAAAAAAIASPVERPAPIVPGSDVGDDTTPVVEPVKAKTPKVVKAKAEGKSAKKK